MWIAAQGTLLVEEGVVKSLELKANEILVSDEIACLLPLGSHDENVLATVADVETVCFGDTARRKRTYIGVWVTGDKQATFVTLPHSSLPREHLEWHVLQHNRVPNSHDSSARLVPGNDLVEGEDVVWTRCEVVFFEFSSWAGPHSAALCGAAEPLVVCREVAATDLQADLLACGIEEGEKERVNEGVSRCDGLEYKLVGAAMNSL